MKTIFHDNESGTKLEMEGTFGNSKARLVDDEGNVTTELEGSYSEILEMISQLSGNDVKGKEEPQEACEAITEEGTPNIKAGDYVKVKEGKECGGAKGFAIVTDIEGDNVRLKGIDENSYYRETWINSVDNVIKIG